MQTTLDAGTRARSSIKRKMAGLLRITLGRIFAYQEMVVLKTSSQIGLKSVAAYNWLKSVTKAEVDIRLADDGDVPKFERFEKFGRGKAGERFKSGHLCFIAEKNGKIVNYTWVCFHEAYVEELERKMRIDPILHTDMTNTRIQSIGV